ncbi:hypothetical protein GCM10010967_57640 [Dyadobacter beijingensis]|uniref:Uncharacterized protein n=1 Tax=Dyadobacter beijingensis TaxID=365489 RepID=A0ABQ2IPF8_9BACT|nr:hypothetical protein [Dyadobacter beijingensis]GGN13909.1 hypothetical protein GCM10010967_57640 [Dyadobacter beijingensis]
MVSFAIKVLLIAGVIVSIVISRVLDLSFTVEGISAVGSLLTGISALIAILGAFYTMRYQVKKTAHSEWLKVFRSECAKVLASSQKLEANSMKSELVEFGNSSMTLLLLLNPRSESQRLLEKMVKDFTIFMMSSDMSDPDFNRVFSKNWNIVLSQMKAIITEEENSF